MKEIWLVLVVGALSLLSCTRGPEMGRRVDLPPPERACPTAIVWQGLVPGLSTREEVFATLGAPSEEYVQTRGRDTQMLVYAYQLQQGDFARDPDVSHKIYFRGDEVIDWMEIIVADEDGRYHAVQEVVDQLGSTLDTVHVNTLLGFSDMVFGPDQLYVWSECGVALNTLFSCLPTDYLAVACATPSHWPDATTPATVTLSLRYPDPPNPRHPEWSSDIAGTPKTNEAIMLKFLFPPTTFEGYQSYFQQAVPFGLWTRAMHEMGRSRTPTPLPSIGGP